MISPENRDSLFYATMFFAALFAIAVAVLRVFTKLKGEHGEEKLRELGIDQFGGCLNVRLKRGSKSSWSIHSWGCAVDLDADRNLFRETARTARFARLEYLPMWKIIEGEGAVSYGRARGWDFMHWQFARP